MPPQPAPTPVRRAVTQLDHRIEAVTGHDIDTLCPTASAASSMNRTPNWLTGTARWPALRSASPSTSSCSTGSRAVSSLSTVLSSYASIAPWTSWRKPPTRATPQPKRCSQPWSPSRPPHHRPPTKDRSRPDDQTALLAIASGAKLHEHLLTGRASVAASSGTRIPYPQMQKLERAGLVVRDTNHPVHAGQPVSLTDSGRAALLDARRTPTTHEPKSPARPGAFPSTPAKRR